MGHNFAQIPPDADVPANQRAAATLSYERTFRFLHDRLAAAAGQRAAASGVPEVQPAP